MRNENDGAEVVCQPEWTLLGFLPRFPSAGIRKTNRTSTGVLQPPLQPIPRGHSRSRTPSASSIWASANFHWLRHCSITSGSSTPPPSGWTSARRAVRGGAPSRKLRGVLDGERPRDFRGSPRSQPRTKTQPADRKSQPQRPREVGVALNAKREGPRPTSTPRNAGASRPVAQRLATSERWPT